MKSSVALGLLVVSLVVAPIGLHAQLGGLLKKKAGDLINAKPAPPAPPATSGTEKKADPPPAPAQAPPGSKPAETPAARAEPKAGASPLEISELNLDNKAGQILRGQMPVQPSGDWEVFPYIGAKVITAAKALDDASRVAYVQKVTAAFKTLVMSDAFSKAHDEYIKSQYKALDHGIKGVVSTDQLMKANNVAGLTAALQRESTAALVDGISTMSPADIQMGLANELEDWTRYAADVKRKDRAKYQKFVRDGQALQQLGTSDPDKLRRGFAVLRSADNDGPDTEAAVYAMHDRVVQEHEQAAWDEHNLKGVLKRDLTAFVALVPTVDFDAATVVKGGKPVFVKPAYEAKGAVWKGCFRAGKASSMAALQFAQAWLKELN